MDHPSEGVETGTQDVHRVTHGVSISASADYMLLPTGLLITLKKNEPFENALDTVCSA